MQRNQHTRHLVLFRKLVQGQRDHLLLAMAVKQYLLAEARVPESRDDGPQVGNKRILRHDHGARHTQVVIRMRTIPHRLGNGASSSLGHRLSHPGNQERVLAKRLGISVGFGAAHRDEDDVVDLEPILDLGLCHGLVVNTRRLVHMTAQWR